MQRELCVGCHISVKICVFSNVQRLENPSVEVVGTYQSKHNPELVQQSTFGFLRRFAAPNYSYANVRVPKRK